MGWLIELAVEAVASFFGHAVGRDRPWWVEIVASLGCLVTLGLPLVLLWFLVR